MKFINIECININISLTNGARINHGSDTATANESFEQFIERTLSDLNTVAAADPTATDKPAAEPVAADVSIPAREPTFDVDGPEPSETVVEDSNSDSDGSLTADPAFGETGTNAAKLAWALARVVCDNDVWEQSQLDESDSYQTIVDRNSPEAIQYANLYRERDGYAKLGAARFSSAHAAEQAATRSNLVAVVGLTNTRYA